MDYFTLSNSPDKYLFNILVDLKGNSFEIRKKTFCLVFFSILKSQ